MGVTLRDVAKLAGVSVSTAAAAIRGEDIVKEETKERVIKAAAELGYAPNAQARALSKGSTGVIAVIVPELLHGYYARIVDAIAYEAPKQGFTACFYQTGYDKDAERDLIRRIGSPICDGFILNINDNFETDVKALIGNKPAVLLNSFSNPPVLDTVVGAYRQSASLMFGYLAGRGYRRVAVAGLDLSLLEGDDSTGRFQSIKEIFDQLRRTRMGDAEDCYSCDWSEYDGRDIAADILDSGRNYDAVIGMNDLVARGVIRGFADRGVQVPGDIAVIGKDDIPGNEFSTPALTTISIDYQAIAVASLRMLRERIHGTPAQREAEPRVEYVNYELHVRESA